MRRLVWALHVISCGRYATLQILNDDRLSLITGDRPGMAGRRRFQLRYNAVQGSRKHTGEARTKGSRNQ
ncbi:MAG: hypothetical protein WCP36_11995 [Methanomicrobiales archaeon]